MAPTATSPSLQGANPLSNLKHKAETKLHDVVNGNSNSNSNSNARSSRPTTALPLIDLYSGTVNADSTASSKRLCADIIQGLKGRSALTVPGDVNNPQDLKFAFKRTLPTMILYDEQGLLFYDKVSLFPTVVSTR